MPRLTNTRELILDAALDLFSERGYDGVGLRNLAQRVGVRESALYKHFRSKQDIFCTLIARMRTESAKVFAAHGMPVADRSEMIERYRTISVEELTQFCLDMFVYNIRNDRTVKFRKVLRWGSSVMRVQTDEGSLHHETAARSDEDVGSAYYSMYIGEVLALYGAIFKGLTDSGVFIETDPDVAALHFYSPIFLLLTSCDEEKITEAEALDRLEKHVRQFLKLYKKN